MRRAVTILLAGVLLAGGCTGDDEPADDDPARPREAAVETWSLDLPLVGPPVLVGDDVAVVMAVEGEDLELVAVDTATGEELWRRTTTPGPEPPAVAVRPRVLTDADGAPVLLYSRHEDGGGPLATTVVRPDPRTGEDLWVTPTLRVTSGPEPCGDGAAGAACVTELAGARVRRAIDLGTGAVTEVAPPGDGIRRAVAGGELVDLRVDREELLARVEGGRVVWQAVVDDAIGPRFTADFGPGWWVHDADAGLFVGAYGRFERADRETDLATFRMVALDEGTGAVVWADDGSTPACLERLALPRPLLAPVAPAGPSLRCRARGTADFPADVDDEVTFAGLDVVLEHFDPATGEVTWELDLGAQPSLPLRNRGVDLRGVGAVAGPRTSVLPVDGTPTLVDLVDGTTSAPDPDAVLACLAPAATFPHADPWIAAGGEAVPTERYADHRVVPCGPDLEPVDAPLPPDVVAAVGVPAGDVTLVALDGRLVGYETP